jgi:hypothetical protein
MNSIASVAPLSLARSDSMKLSGEPKYCIVIDDIKNHREMIFRRWLFSTLKPLCLTIDIE